MSKLNTTHPLGFLIQPACLQHRYIRHANSSHIFERPERLRAVLLGVAAAVARLEEAEENVRRLLDGMIPKANIDKAEDGSADTVDGLSTAPSDDLSSMLSSLSINFSQTFTSSTLLDIVTPPSPPSVPGQILLHHPALQLAHSPPAGSPFPSSSTASSPYLKDLFKWASEAIEKIKETGNEIPPSLNQSDLYLGPGSILAIEGAVSTCLSSGTACLPGTDPDRLSSD